MSKAQFCEQLNSYIKSLNTKMKIEKKSQNTLLSYMRTYKDFIIFCEQHYKELTFKNIKEDDIYAFLEYKSQNMQKQGDISVSTSNAIVSHLKRLFKHIERNSDELHDFDRVFEDIKLKQPTRKPKGLSEEQVDKLLKYLESLKVDETYTNFRNIFLFKLMIFGGLRASEAVSIMLSNVKQTEESNLYKITFKGKGDKDRFTYIKVDDIEDEISTLKKVFDLNDDVFIAKTSTGNQMDRIQLSKMVNSMYGRAGVKASSVHVLRHTAAKRLLANGVSIVVVQSLLGHSSIQTTSIYANPTEDIIKKEMQRI
ncbi:MAG: tyrosine-type recombinase/integrase [Sulfurimonas sp.]|jgi:integrase/recombinase XerD